MKCPNCGNEFVENAKFCGACGAELSQQTDAVSDAPVSNEESMPVQEPACANDTVQPEQDASKVPVEEPIDEGEAASEAEKESSLDEKIEKIPEIAPRVKKNEKKAKEHKFKLPKKFVKVAFAVLGVLVLIVLVAALAKSCESSSAGKGNEDYPLIYSSDGEIKFLNEGQKKGKILEDADDISVKDGFKVTNDGKYLFFATDSDGREFDLNVRLLSNKSSESNSEIVKGIEEYNVSPDGKTIIYVKNNDLYKVNRNGKKTVKLGNNVREYEISPDFDAVLYENDDEEVFYSTGIEKTHNHIADVVSDMMFSEDGKNIIIVEKKIDDSYNTKLSISLCGTGKKDKPEKLESGIEDGKYVFANEDCTKFYFVRKKKLYLKNGSRDGVEVEGIDGEIRSITTHIEGKDRYFYAVAEKETAGEYRLDLYFVDGNKATLMVEDFGDESYFGQKVVCTYHFDYDKGEYGFKYFVRLDYNNLCEFEMPEQRHGRQPSYCLTDENIYVIENVNEENSTGDLVVYAFTNKGIDFENGKTIAEDVLSVSSSYADFFEKETVLIMHDSHEYSVYTGGKKAVEIPADVENFVWFNKDGTMILEIDYSNNDGTVSLAKFDGKRLTEFAEDVTDYFIYDEKMIYYINEDGKLILNKGKMNKDKIIENDAYGLYHHGITTVIGGNHEDAESVFPMIEFEY